MSGPPPKPRDQRARRNTDSGTTSTSVVLEDLPSTLPEWVGETSIVKIGGWEVEVPKPPSGLLKGSKEAWATYWSIAEVQMLRPHHVQALRRLVRMYDQEERIRRRVDRTHLVALPAAVGMDGEPVEGELVLEQDMRMVRIPGHLGVGSQGQLVESPDFKALAKVRAQISALEDRFAATPLAQFRVGWQQAAMVTEQSRAREATALAEAAAQIAAQHEQMLGDSS